MKLPDQPNSLSPQADITYASPQPPQHDALRAMARQCFSDTFSDLYDPDAFAHGLDDFYGTDGAMAKDLHDPHVSWWVALCESQPVGYAKLTPLRAPAPHPLPGAVELQQLYVLSPWQGQGVADQLMEWALKTAQQAHAPEIYLTVFDHNERAKRFYTRYLFHEVGHCVFTLGDRHDDDRVWCRHLRHER